MPFKALWPSRPPIEDLSNLQNYLESKTTDSEVFSFCKDLARDGIALIDLGPEGRALCDGVVRATEPLFSNGQIQRVQDAWLKHRAVRRLATLPKVTKLLEIAYGRPPFAFQTLNFKVGTEQNIHSDTIHFHSEPERFMCGVWTALEDISEESGPLTYFPGSHRLPILTMRRAGVNHLNPTYEDYVNTYLPDLARRLEASGLLSKVITIPKGKALVWAANLAHGGARIIDNNRTRRSLVTHFYFRDCVYYTPMASDVEEGRLFVRLPLDVKTGGFRFSQRSGQLVWPHFSQLKSAARKILLREVICS